MTKKAGVSASRAKIFKDGRQICTKKFEPYRHKKTPRGEPACGTFPGVLDRGVTGGFSTLTRLFSPAIRRIRFGP
jgi:hypothetical protein